MDGFDVLTDSVEAWPSAGLMDSDAFVQSFSFNTNKEEAEEVFFLSLPFV